MSGLSLGKKCRAHVTGGCAFSLGAWRHHKSDIRITVHPDFPNPLVQQRFFREEARSLGRWPRDFYSIRVASDALNMCQNMFAKGSYFFAASVVLSVKILGLAGSSGCGDGRI